MIATLIHPDSGNITWNGQDIMVMDEDYRGLLGYLPQKFGYYPDYSAEDFLTYIAALQGIGHKRAKPLVKDLLETVGLKNQGKQKMKTLSGGMIQRVGLAQAMINDPELMILDEPTAGLDPRERVRFRNLVHALSRDRTVILSTHIVSDLETIADRVIMLKDGSLTWRPSPTGSSCSRMDRGWTDLLQPVPKADKPLDGRQNILGSCRLPLRGGAAAP